MGPLHTCTVASTYSPCTLHGAALPRALAGSSRLQHRITLPRPWSSNPPLLSRLEQCRSYAEKIVCRAAASDGAAAWLSTGLVPAMIFRGRDCSGLLSWLSEAVEQRVGCSALRERCWSARPSFCDIRSTGFPRLFLDPRSLCCGYYSNSVNTTTTAIHNTCSCPPTSHSMVLLLPGAA